VRSFTARAATLAAAALLTTAAALPSQAVAISDREIPAPNVVALAGTSGTLWYATPTQLKHLDASGKLLGAYALPRGVSVAAGSPGEPFPVARDGGMWFMATRQLHGRKVWLIGSISRTGHIKLRKLRRGHGGNLLVRDSHGNSWFADHVTRHHKRFAAIGELTKKGRLKDVRLPGRATKLTSVAIGPDGKTWLTSCGDNGQAAYVAVIARRHHVRRFAINGPWCPSDIAPGPDGALWFTLRLYTLGPINDAIGRITTSGATHVYALDRAVGPEGIVAGPDGALWFSEHESGGVGRISTSGSYTAHGLRGLATPTQIVSGPGAALWLLDTENSEAPSNPNSKLAIVKP
jgi:virginiamycin B lyase